MEPVGWVLIAVFVGIMVGIPLIVRMFDPKEPHQPSFAEAQFAQHMKEREELLEEEREDEETEAAFGEYPPLVAQFFIQTRRNLRIVSRAVRDGQDWRCEFLGISEDHFLEDLEEAYRTRLEDWSLNDLNVSDLPEDKRDIMTNLEKLSKSGIDQLNIAYNALRDQKREEERLFFEEQRRKSKTAESL